MKKTRKTPNYMLSVFEKQRCVMFDATRA